MMNGIVINDRIVDKLTKSIAGSASPFDSNVNKTTKPATGQEVNITVVKSEVPVTPNDIKINIEKIGYIKFFKRMAKINNRLKLKTFN